MPGGSGNNPQEAQTFLVFLSQDAVCLGRVLDKFKPGEVCNLVWGLAHLGCQPGADLLQQVVQASQDWSEVSRPVSILPAVVTGLPFQFAAVIEVYFLALLSVMFVFLYLVSLDPFFVSAAAWLTFILSAAFSRIHSDCSCQQTL